MVPVGPRRVLVEPVRERFPGERAEVPVEDRVVLGQRSDDRQVRYVLAAAVGIPVGVVPDRERVGGGQGDTGVIGGGGGGPRPPPPLCPHGFGPPPLPPPVRPTVYAPRCM